MALFAVFCGDETFAADWADGGAVAKASGADAHKGQGRVARGVEHRGAAAFCLPAEQVFGAEREGGEVILPRCDLDPVRGGLKDPDGVWGGIGRAGIDLSGTAGGAIAHRVIAGFGGGIHDAARQRAT